MTLRKLSLTRLAAVLQQIADMDALPLAPSPLRAKEEPVRDLNHDFKQLCRHNRDGSYATQADREHILDLVANQLHEMECHFANAAGPGGSTSLLQTGSEYDELLGLPTKPTRKSFTTG